MKMQLGKCLIGTILLIITSCGKNGKEYDVNIDQQVSELILSYIKENNIDTKSKVIVTQWVITPFERSDIYISNTIYASYKDLKSAPTYYCVLDDGTPVFIYSNLERFIHRNSNEVIDEIDHILRDCKVNLKRDSAQFYYAPTWLYTVCGDTSIVRKKIPALEYTTIPCDYVLLQDTVTKNSLRLIKRQQ